VTLDAGANWSGASPLPRPARILSATAWNGSFFAGTEDALWRRDGNGGPWSEVSLPTAGPFRHLAAGQQTLLIGSNTRILELRGDGTFADRSAGINPSLLTHLWVVDDRPFAGNSTAGYLHQWNAAGEIWQTLSVPLPFRCFAGSGNTMLTSSGKLSEDGGKTWASLNQFPGISPPGFITLTFADGHFQGGDGKGGVWKYSTYLPTPTSGITHSEGGRDRIKAPTYGQSWFRDGEARIDGRRIRQGRVKR
jgi:hypothetical protein